MSAAAARRPVVIVTGLSGAGRATILRCLEDMGFETVDNPPLALLESALGDGEWPIAVGVDTRSRGFAPEVLLTVRERLRLHPSLEPTLVFATAEEDVLLRRYTETRRRHPLAPGGALGTRVQDGIARERELMAPLREAADLIIDTTDLPLPELRRRLEARFRPAGAPGLNITILSFAFPKGLPREADMVFDLRFLSNPHYVEELRPLTGLDPRVAAHVEADPAFAPFWSHLTGLLSVALPGHAREGRSYVTIALGCTGGRHRSVAAACRLHAWLAGMAEANGWQVALAHRELPEAARAATTLSAGLSVPPGPPLMASAE
ncbi:MAG: RNase adapter RapZ [Rhodovarius sp.]|nr:RNase adapter RapZ [Rhodovarius sp.]MCX7932604.1 RNase adapter RapZ [Rhodovarius sp.]MDW8315981.1 RNase adapter RapZ [Rhodovarius sp.]